MPQFHSWFQQRSATQWIFALVVIAFAARAAVILGIGDNHRAYYEYMQIAQNLLDGKGYSWDEWGRALLQPTSFLPPVYVYWCAMFMSALSSDYTLMYILQAMIAASGCIPAFLIGKRMFSGTAGIIFAALYALYQEFVFLP